jgi:hypothetical protein
MARSDAYATTLQSPVKKYLSWASNDKCFTYWDKETEKDRNLPLPINFIHYDEMATIKGWHEDSDSRIFSNEVKSTLTEPFSVKAWKHKGTVIEGLYQAIKDRLKAAGGKYTVSLYAELDGEIVNFSFKGAALAAWSDFAKENRKAFLGNYVKISGALDAKKGSVKHSVPVFELGSAIEASVSDKSDKNYDLLQEYFKARKNSADTHTEEHYDSTPEPAIIPVQESSIPAFDEPADTSDLSF